MGQNYCQTALTCPKCGEKAVFIRSRIIKVDGETVGIVSPYKAVAGDGSAKIAQVFQLVALDVTSEEQVHIDAGGGMVGMDLIGQAPPLGPPHRGGSP